MLISVQLQQQIDIVSCYERWKRKSARAEKYHKKSRKENGDKKVLHCLKFHDFECCCFRFIKTFFSRNEFGVPFFSSSVSSHVLTSYTIFLEIGKIQPFTFAQFTLPYPSPRFETNVSFILCVLLPCDEKMEWELKLKMIVKIFKTFEFFFSTLRWEQ